MERKKIILSYDYELFFGERSGTVLKSIVDPTNKLMNVMERNGLRGNFFVDYLMFRELERQKEARAQADLRQLKEQVRDMVRRGHRIELHLHPHWIDAKYNGDGTWNFDDFTHYSLNSLDEETIVEMFRRGTDYLTALAREVKPDYRIVAFRAGGWAVQPFDKLKRAFIEAGIKVDSSTSFGIYRYQKDSNYDFRQMPDKAMYHFEDDVCKEVADGQFIEVPITSFHNTFLLFCFERLVFRFTDFCKTYADGTHFRSDAAKPVKTLKKKFLEKFRKDFRCMCNFSSITALSLYYAMGNQKEDLCCFIDHPKDVGKCTLSSLNNIGKRYNSMNYIDLIDEK